MVNFGCQHPTLKDNPSLIIVGAALQRGPIIGFAACNLPYSCEVIIFLRSKCWSLQSMIVNDQDEISRLKYRYNQR